MAELTASIRLYEVLQKRFGKEEARELAVVLEEVLEEMADRKKEELKKELPSDLATKQDIKVLEAEIDKVRTEIKRVEDTLTERIERVEDTLRAEIRRIEAYVKIMIVLLLVAIALYSPVFAELVGRFLKP